MAPEKQVRSLNNIASFRIIEKTALTCFQFEGNSIKKKGVYNFLGSQIELQRDFILQNQ